MPLDLRDLIWLFPIAFMFHDFEEIILGEAWLKKNAEEIKARVPAFLAGQISSVLDKTTGELVLPVGLIFTLAFISSALAVAYKIYVPFFFASSMFFLHGFMHLGQAILLRKYVPAVISSALIVIPYGAGLYWVMIKQGVIGLTGMAIYFIVAASLTVPFLLVMHRVGDYLNQKQAKGS